jgi:hypothetical protein
VTGGGAGFLKSGPTAQLPSSAAAANIVKHITYGL